MPTLQFPTGEIANIDQNGNITTNFGFSGRLVGNQVVDQSGRVVGTISGNTFTDVNGVRKTFTTTNQSQPSTPSQSVVQPNPPGKPRGGPGLLVTVRFPNGGTATFNPVTGGPIISDFGFSGRIDAYGNVYDNSGNFVGKIQGGNFISANGTTTPYQTIASVSPPSGGSILPGTRTVIRFPNGGTATIHPNGTVTSDFGFSGRVDKSGTIFDASGKIIGVLTSRYVDINGQRTPIEIIEGSLAPAAGEIISGGSPGGNTGGGNTGGGAPGTEEDTSTAPFVDEAIRNLRGLSTEATDQFLKARDIINAALDRAAQRTNDLQDIYQQLSFLGRETFNILDPVRRDFQSKINQYIQGLSDFQGRTQRNLGDVDRISQEIENRARALEDINIPFGEQEAAALSALARQISNRLAGQSDVIGGIQRQEIGLSNEAAQALRDVIAGRINLPEFQKIELERAQQALEDRLRRNLGTGFETSTPGTQALLDFERTRQGVLDEFRQQELARMLGVLTSQQSGAIQAGDLIRGLELARAQAQAQAAEAARLTGQARGQFELGKAETALKGRLAGLESVNAKQSLAEALSKIPLMAAQARAGETEYIGNIANLGFGLGSNLANFSSNVLAQSLVPAEARINLAQSAIDSLGKAYLLPLTAQERGLALATAAAAPIVGFDASSLLSNLVSSGTTLSQQRLSSSSDIIRSLLSQQQQQPVDLSGIGNLLGTLAAAYGSSGGGGAGGGGGGGGGGGA